MMQKRFVIQLHTTQEGSHYDLMLETHAALATWRIDRAPTALGPHDRIPATALPDHRLAYLTYEGPISHGRGAVRIFDSGTWRLIQRSEEGWVVQLSGSLLKGAFALRHLRQERWELLSAESGAEPARNEPQACPE